MIRGARGLVGSVGATGPSAVSITAVGDSITAANQPGMDLYSNTPAQFYAQRNRVFRFSSWLNQAAQRTSHIYTNQYIYGWSGATAAEIAASVLPVLLNNPDARSKPHVCFVLAGTNDVPTNAPSVVVASLNKLYGQLLAAGIIPIACTIPPRDGANQQVLVDAINKAIVANARTYGYPLADFHSALQDPTNGKYISAYQADGTHPSVAGYTVMSYVAYQVLTALFPEGRARKSMALYDNSAITMQTRNPNLSNALAVGTINTSGSRPGTTAGRQTLAMCSASQTLPSLT